MQIQVLQQNKPVVLNVISTQKGRLALTTDEPTPRERQLLLLLDKEDSDLSRQAISLLLAKLDLNKITKKGWVEYFVFDSQLPDVLIHAREPTHNQHKNLKNFLNEYSHHDESLTKPIPHVKAETQHNAVPKHEPKKNYENISVISLVQDTVPINTLEMFSTFVRDTEDIANEDLDDLTIIQTLLNED